MEELHLTRKDFLVEYFSGSGGGGQHRNRHNNCCRITHKDTGLKAQSTAHKEREANRREAFQTLAARIIDFFSQADKPQRRTDSEVVRTYHSSRNEVVDHASGHRQTYKRVVVDANIGEMIEARRCSITDRKPIQWRNL